MINSKIKIAYHETGHAVMALICRQRVQKLSLKGMDSPTGNDKYLGFMKLEPAEAHAKFTLEKAIHKVMISLGGFASEVIFFDGMTNIGGDDLTVAVNTTKEMLQISEFKNWVTRLTLPNPGPLDMVENPLIRAYIDHMMGDCINVLVQHKPLLKIIIEELIKKEELSGKEILIIFDSYMGANF